MNVQHFKLNITLRSPFLIPATQINQLGHDVSQMRDVNTGQALIPGDLIKGLLRHAMYRIEQSIPDKLPQKNITEFLFGQNVQENNDRKTNRGRVVISDLQATEHPPQDWSTDQRYTRVKISTKTGAAETGQLQQQELMYPPGQEVLFSGKLVLFDVGRNYVNWIKNALQLIPAIGANKSIGFGEVVSITSVKHGVSSANTTDDIEYQDKVRMKLKFTHPLLFDTERIAGNVFKSREVIPGAVIKGALAASITDGDYLSGEQGEALRKMRMGFAFPAFDTHEVYQPIPLSLMVNPEDGTQIVDAATSDVPFLINGLVPTPLAKAKDAIKEQALKTIGRHYPSLSTEVRTRTNIAYGRNTAQDNRLFSYEMICPDQVTWVAEINRNGANQQQYQKLLQVLTRGLHRVGKTEAWAEVALCDSNLDDDSIHSDRMVVQLITPALMIDATAEIVASRGLLALYQAYWSSISGERLQLQKIFTQERLIGDFQAYQYRFRRDSPKTYQPYILTEPGSVFVLKGEGVCLSHWCQAGLPLPHWISDDDDPKQSITCPFEPENGYGDFVLNPSRSLNLPALDTIGVRYVK